MSLILLRSYDQRYNASRIKAGSLDYVYTRNAGGQATSVTGAESPRITVDTTFPYSYKSTNNQLISVPPKSYTYDAVGNIVSDGTSSFTWDGLNRLIKVKEGIATVAEYGYDAANRRIRKTVGATTTHYLYDLNNQLIAETLANGTVLREYIYLDGEPLALKEYQTNPGTYYFLNDHLGTPQQLVTANGTTVWKAAYLPYGQAQIKTATVANNLRFPGQYFDAETGLHYNWNRYYNPEVGRYVSADPIGLAGGMNLYSYVSNDPVNAVDPWGLWAHGFPTNISEVPGIGDPINVPYMPGYIPWYSTGNYAPGFNEQDNICSSPAGYFNRNKCTKRCCQEHDKCYEKNGCNASSWLGNFFGDHAACQKCNRAAVKCISENFGNNDDCDC